MTTKNWKHQFNMDFSHIRGGDLNEIILAVEELLAKERDENYEGGRADMRAEIELKAEEKAYKELKERHKRALVRTADESFASGRILSRREIAEMIENRRTEVLENNQDYGKNPHDDGYFDGQFITLDYLLKKINL